MDGIGVEHVIRLTDSGPWGFRLGGGDDFGCPLQVAKVRVNSKSYNAGLEEGDIITHVNDRDVRLSSHANAMQVIEAGGDDMTITVLRGVSSLDTVYRTFIESSRAAAYSQQQSAAVNASIVRSVEPNISRAHVSMSREASPSRSLHVITRSVSRDNMQGYGGSTPGGLLTVNSTPPRSPSYRSFKSEVNTGKLLIGKPERCPLPPAASHLPVHRATSLPRATPGTTITHHNIPLISSVPEIRSDSHTQQYQSPPSPHFTFGQRSEQPVVVPIKPFEMPRTRSEIIEFKVRNMDAPKHVWQPTFENQQPVRDQYGNVVEYPPNPNTNTTSGQDDHEKQPANFYWELMENQPDHLPGYVDPLIVDDTQGDFGGNPIIRPERDLYSDSSFYKTKDRMYPTINEQMKMCRMISGILEAPDAMRSRGGKMYLKRKQGAEQHAKEAMGRKFEKPYDGMDAEYTRPYDTFHHWTSAMKENLTVDELERLEHNTQNLSKHDLLPPVVAFDINSALKNSKNHGKGVEIFRRNQERAEQFTVDENNRKRNQHQNRLDTQLDQFSQFLNNYKSPWKAAWEGNLDRAFAPVDPCAAQSVRDEPELRKDENQHALQYNHQQATFGVKYKNIAPVHAPRGPGTLGRQMSSSTSALDKMGLPEPRLSKMIAPREDERATFDTYTYKWCMPSYYGRDLMSASVDERMARSQLGSAGWYRRPTDNFSNPMSYSNAELAAGNLTLRRPKDFVKQKSTLDVPTTEEPAYSFTDSYSDYGPPPSLRRPKEYYNQGQSLYGSSYYMGQSDLSSPHPGTGVSAY